MQKHIAHEEGYKYLPHDDYHNYFYVSDIDIASTCICKNHELVALERGSGDKATFVFKNQADISKIVEDFWDNKIQVYPLEFANTRKNLKSRIYGMNKSY